MQTTDDWGQIAGNRGASPEQRVDAIRALTEMADPHAVGEANVWNTLLVRILCDESEDDDVRIAAVHAAPHFGGMAVNTLCRSLSPHKPHIRTAMVAALRTIASQPLPEAWEHELNADLAQLNGEITMVPFCNLTLSHGADERVISVLEKAQEDPSPSIRGLAVFQLAQVGDLKPAIDRLASDPDAAVRMDSAQAIGYYWTGGSEATAALRSAVGDTDSKVAREAKSALRRIGLLALPSPPESSVIAVGDLEVDSRFPWAAFLHQWSLELCGDNDFVLTQDEAVIESGWTGHDPVADGALRDLEDRLGMRLPPSYRAFLQTTDGYVGGGTVERIRPAHKVAPFIQEESERVDIWLGTAGAGESLTVAEHIATRGQDPVWARWELLLDAVQVSDSFDGAVYLLCPTIVDANGEWEAWIFANWLPGALRFTSWWSLLKQEYQGWAQRQ